MRVQPRASLIAVALLAICLGGPLVTLAAWAVLVGREAWRSWRLGCELVSRSVAADVAGMRCRVVAGADLRAFALGLLRPTIYVSERLLVELPAHELRAVVLHEEYHRRTYGPLRAAALRALLDRAVLPRSVRARFADRLVDLECEADAFAMRRGSHPASLAAALVRVDAADTLASAAFAANGARGIDFGAAGDRRVSALLAAAADPADRPAPLPPLEWLVPLAGLVLPLACFLAGFLPRL